MDLSKSKLLIEPDFLLGLLGKIVLFLVAEPVVGIKFGNVTT